MRLPEDFSRLKGLSAKRALAPSSRQALVIHGGGSIQAGSDPVS